MRFLQSVLCGVLFVTSAYGASPFSSASKQKARELVNQMSEDEKISFTSGAPEGVARLGVPGLAMWDGPQGVGDGQKQVTCWSCALSYASTFDEDLAFEIGVALGKENFDKGSTVMLGPDINIMRAPLDARAFETFGEDPYLSGMIASNVIKGIQSQHVLANAKHYLNNDQEINRWKISAEVDERTEREIYLAPFQDAVDAGVGSVMCSYNKIHGTYACENPTTLGWLKNDLGFDGFVISDWGATHSTAASANAGLDIDMPGGDGFMGADLKNAISSGGVPSSRLDDIVYRILVPMIEYGLFDVKPTGGYNSNVRSDAHVALARKICAQSMILAKNDHNVLPLDLNTVKTVAIIGSAGNDQVLYTGGGSGVVDCSSAVSPLSAFNSLLGQSIRVISAGDDVGSAVNAAKQADVVFVFGSTKSAEGWDRGSLSLDSGIDNLISSVGQANRNTIAVLEAPGAILMPWVNNVAGVIIAMYPGEQFGPALVDIVTGTVNPAGRLPLTFPVDEGQLQFTNDQYPGDGNTVVYTEKLEVGYRHYDAKNLDPLFPFGHGLSYTTFNYSNTQVTSSSDCKVSVSFDVCNSGDRSGKTFPQIYLGYPQAADEPPKVLKRVAKVSLDANACSTVKVDLVYHDLKIWDSQWKVVDGDYTVFVADSAKNVIKTVGTSLTCSGSPTDPPTQSSSPTTSSPSTASPSTSPSTASPTTTNSPTATGDCHPLWKQCGGPSYTGPMCCDGLKCVVVNQWYSMCSPPSQ